MKELIIMETKICSKCGIEKLITDYHKNGFDSQGNQKYRGYCKECACKTESARYKAKQQFVNSQKKECLKCGEKREYVLDFHHKDPNVKEFTIGKTGTRTVELLQQEIDKCVVLCANCHREFHYLEKNNGISLDEYLL